MKKTILILKIIAIVALFTVAVIGIFAEPYGQEHWVLKLILSKVIGFGSAFIAITLTTYWNENGSFEMLSKFINED